MSQPWPRTLWIVRHGQSAGNVARDAAEASGLAMIDIAERDIDVPLSPLGREQSVALGHWFGELPPDRRPEVVLTSPYVRARETTRLLMESAGLDPRKVRVRIDERLREKEFGILDRLTVLGIREKYPELSAQRRHVGKFYFRPPGGESWCDVILRLRSVLEMMTREHCGQRVLVVAHQVIVNCMRYLIECLEEHEVLDLDRQADVPNCGVTSYEHDPSTDSLVLDLANFVAPLREAGAPVTVEPDALAAPKP
ncbi:histidine phosphatase family protein [Ramlibacter henchirensis]|uniref:Histidine phosphatase family protein n=1 Tax=Ramlibacter henchirensis TaxID=204072 RepID=A0A4Z0C8H1_9BURK|nr:histidine phosphatase family protein [Ramlibacter henchirensis]TFZ07284.1 histidine phosphatase family protein [Ramlibacter henchirensis]